MTPDWPFIRRGTYHRKRAPRSVHRFTCRACNRHFSSQTFATSYWLKRPDLTPRIALMVVGCMANRQIAYALGCSPSTVALHIARLARHCLLIQAQALETLPPLDEIVIDGFESFEYSQYFPFHHNVAVDVASGYFLYHTDSPLRRKGRMRPHQKARRARLERRLGRPAPRAVETGIRDLLEVLPQPIQTIRSDDHRAYPQAIAQVALTHRVTSSKQRRNHRNPLWEVNLLDLMIRHTTAAHKRETIAWAKRRQAAIEKLAIFQVWRNYIKRRHENGPRVTSAMLIGLADRPWTIRDVLRRRRFAGKVPLSPRWTQYYRRELITRALPVNRTHDLTYAF